MESESSPNSIDGLSSLLIACGPQRHHELATRGRMVAFRLNYQLRVLHLRNGRLHSFCDRTEDPSRQRRAVIAQSRSSTTPELTSAVKFDRWRCRSVGRPSVRHDPSHQDVGRTRPWRNPRCGILRSLWQSLRRFFERLTRQGWDR